MRSVRLFFKNALKLPPFAKVLLKTLVSLSLLAWLAQQVNWGMVWHQALTLPPWTLPVSVALYAMAQWLSALRWQAFAAQLDMPQPINRLYPWYLVGMVYNQLLPGTIGGDGYRIVQLANACGKPKRLSLVTVLAERGSGLLVMLWLTVLLGYNLPNKPFFSVLVGMAVISLSGVIALAAFPFHRSTFTEWLVPAQQLIRQPRSLLLSIGLSVVVQSLMISIHALLVPRAGLDWNTLGWAYGSVSLLTLIPIGLNGIGLRELGYITLLSHYTSVEIATSLSLLWFGIGIMTSWLGLPFLFLQTNKQCYDLTQEPQAF